MKAHLNHIGILITDLQKARHFYSDILGFQEIERPPFLSQGLWYNLGEFELHLMVYEQAPCPPRHPLNETVQPHFALSIKNSYIIRILEKLKYHNIPLIKEPEKSSIGLLQVFFYDFDKNMIELNNRKISQS